MPTNDANILAVWADLRHADAVELAHSAPPGEHPLRALIRMVREDRSARCSALDGRPVALWGFHQTGRGRHPWMLATRDIRRIGKEVTRLARAHVAALAAFQRAGRSTVWNIVHAESPSVRWLERVGFTIGEPFLRDCPNGERALYRPFWIA